MKNNSSVYAMTIIIERKKKTPTTKIKRKENEE
jgi:hypothetical protein